MGTPIVSDSFTARSVCVLGLGYIGLPTAAILASRGHMVRGVDINPATVDIINSGRIHIVEPELDLLVKTAVDSGRLSASLKPSPSEVFMICVPTPVNHATHEPVLDFVKNAAESILPVVKAGDLVILESTSPPGTTEQVVGNALRRAGFEPGRDVRLAYCPERVLPGSILREAVDNDRIVGGLTPECSRAVAEFYGTFVQGEILVTNCRTAEMVKLVENASRDAQIAFANEVSLLADRVGVNPWEVIRLANHHPRVNILQPGPGVGGHCIAVDPWFLVHSAPEVTTVMRAVRDRNDAMPLETARRIAKAAAERGARTVALLGMAYKNDIDDCRESPSLHVYAELTKVAPGLDVYACEPHVATLEGIRLLTFVECIEKADILAILVAHRDFRNYDWASLPAGKLVMDFKGILQA